MLANKLQSARQTGQSESLEFADKVRKRLASGLIDQTLCAEIRIAISNLPQTFPRKKSPLSAELDQKGTEIWNLGHRLGQEDAGDVTKALSLTKAFALALLRAAFYSSGVKDSRRNEAIIRLLRTSLKAALSCINSTELDLAMDILQDAADHAAHFTEHLRPDPNGGQTPLDGTAHSLVAEYWLLRTTLSWKQARLDLAKMHFRNIADNAGTPNNIKIKVSDLAHEIGKDVLRRSEGAECIPWFEAGFKALDHIPYDEIDSEALVLRSSISRDLARALILERTDESHSRAADLISYLENEQGTRLGVLLLKIDLLCSREPLDPTEYHRVILQMIQKTVLNRNTFKAILLQIQKLQSLSGSLACRSLESLLSLRLFEFGDQSFIEKTAIMLVWTCSAQPLDGTVFTALHEILDATSHAISSTFSDEATHAAQTLCWKCIGASAQAKQLETAEQWCRLAMHQLFANSGDNNKAKIARKLMIVALAGNKTSVAREAFYQMPQSGQCAPYSQYLLYRIALLDGEESLGNECLANLLGHRDTEAELLYACAQEAQQLSSRAYTLTALRTILDRANLVHLDGVTMPTLVRCMVQMLIAEIEKENGKGKAHLPEVYKLLQTSASSMQWTESSSDDVHVHKELEWFAKTSYNTALKYMDQTEPMQTLDAIDACVEFTRQLISLEDERGKDQARQRLLVCQYIGASACGVLARSVDDMASSEENYNRLLKYTSGFFQERAHMTKQIALEDEAFSMTAKNAQLLRLEIEALFKLKQFERLGAVLENCVMHTDGDGLETLADLIISIHSVMLEQQVDSRHLNKIPPIMQAIVNQSWRYEKGNMSKLARWLRCIFRMTSTTSPETALRILEQAAAIAGGSSSSRVSQQYPIAELEWLASTAFNVAVDRFCASDQEGCRIWAESALNLAKASTGSPRLFAQIQGLWMQLQAQQAIE